MPPNNHQNQSSQFQSHSHSSGLVLNYFSGDFYSGRPGREGSPLQRNPGSASRSDGEDSDGGAPVRTPRARQPRRNRNRNQGERSSRRQRERERFDRADAILPQPRGHRSQARTQGITPDDALRDIQAILQLRPDQTWGSTALAFTS